MASVLNSATIGVITPSVHLVGWPFDQPNVINMRVGYAVTQLVTHRQRIRQGWLFKDLPGA